MNFCGAQRVDRDCERGPVPHAEPLRLFPEPGPRAFSIPPGLPFAKSLAEGVLDRLTRSGAGPEALADVEIVVSTRRAARDLRSAFVAANGGAALGPRLRTLDGLGSDPRLPCDAPPAIESGRRLLLLTRLVRRLLEIDPSLAAPAVAPALAADLAALLGAAHQEGVSLDRLDEIAADRHAEHWARSKRFLDIVREVWPRILAEEGKIDPEARTRRVVAALADLWGAKPRRNPLIVAGSTGSRDASAWFIALAAALPQGAVVLPGFDAEMDVRTRETLVSGAAPEHPQALLAGLLERIGVAPEAVRPWRADPRPHGAARARLFAQALRPAPVTDAWREAAEPLAAEAAGATGRLTLIEAPGPREEAAAIALALREAIETPGRKAALITPDRTLARRVSAELRRWGVNADDSGGRPLPLTPPGVFFTLVCETVLSGYAPAPLLSLLKHPLCFAGYERGAHQRAARRFERRVLRAGRGATGPDALRTAAQEVDQEVDQEADREDAARGSTDGTVDAPVDDPTGGPEAPVAAAGSTPDLGPWFDALLARLAPLDAALSAEAPDLTEILAAHEEAATALSLPPGTERSELFAREAGETLQKFLWKTLRAAEDFGPLAPADYPLLLKQLMAGESVREAFGQHARVAILGTLEARMLSADVVAIAGLNEGVWPKPEEPDPWISRDMRAALGLPPLESRIGLSAHDFFQAAMAETAVLSRTRKQDGAPTVASRWLLRLTTLLEGVAPDALAAMRARGAEWLALADRLDPVDQLAPEARRPAARPAPKPPVAARPRTLSVTDVETLIRDPYALYAKRVLRLRPLPDLEEAPDARERGQALHRIVEQLARQTLETWPPEDAESLYDAIVTEALAPIEPWPMRHAFWRARALQIRDWHFAEETARRATGGPAALEAAAQLAIDTALGPVTLTAQADRIDRRRDGRFALYDFKSGAPPTANQVAHFAKQLPLEAAMLARTAFDGAGGLSAGPGPVAEIAYLALSGGRKGGERKPLFEGEETAAADAALAGLARLCSAYADPALGYRSRARPEHLTYAGDYDHLARVGEWTDGVADGFEEARS